jgi:hypothetical protein
MYDSVVSFLPSGRVGGAKGIERSLYFVREVPILGRHVLTWFAQASVGWCVVRARTLQALTSVPWRAVWALVGSRRANMCDYGGVYVISSFDSWLLCL